MSTDQFPPEFLDLGDHAQTPPLLHQNCSVFLNDCAQLAMAVPPMGLQATFLVEFSFVELGTIFHFMRIPECGAAGYGVGDDMMRWTYWIVRVRENPVA